MPGAILCTTVHVGPVLQQDVQDVSPAPGASLMQGRVAGIVAVVHIFTVFLKAVEDNVLWGQGGRHEQRGQTLAVTWVRFEALHVSKESQNVLFSPGTDGQISESTVN